MALVLVVCRPFRSFVLFAMCEFLSDGISTSTAVAAPCMDPPPGAIGPRLPFVIQDEVAFDPAQAATDPKTLKLYVQHVVETGDATGACDTWVRRWAERTIKSNCQAYYKYCNRLIIVKYRGLKKCDPYWSRGSSWHRHCFNVHRSENGPNRKRHRSPLSESERAAYRQRRRLESEDAKHDTRRRWKSNVLEPAAEPSPRKDMVIGADTVPQLRHIGSEGEDTASAEPNNVSLPAPSAVSNLHDTDVFCHRQRIAYVTLGEGVQQTIHQCMFLKAETGMRVVKLGGGITAPHIENSVKAAVEHARQSYLNRWAHVQNAD